MPVKKSKKLGEILLASGLITQKQLEEALEVSGKRMGEALVGLGYVSEEDISKALAKQYNLDYIDIQKTTIAAPIISIVPESLARKHLAIPVSRSGDTIVVAVCDPLNVLALDDIIRYTNLYVKLAISTQSDILSAISRYYAAAKDIEDLEGLEDIGKLEILEGEAEEVDQLQRLADDVSVVRLVNRIIAQAVSRASSDIHIEPDGDTLRIRFRIDGIMRDIATFPIKVHPAVTSRLKILSGMDIAEKRHPQDGRFVTRMGGRDIDMRASTLPTIYGEKMVLRLLDKSSSIMSLEALSPCTDSTELLKSMMTSPYGIILVTGPTGSGKTTTLYSLLAMLDSKLNNIVTVEDPVEYQVERINQVQVNPKADLPFASMLRHILRQDPDMIMIGEIRDVETAEIAINAALTGHLVLSTLHTNRIAGTVGRLIDMGIEPFLIASAVIGIANQRLVRKICTKCKTSYEVNEAVRVKFNLSPKALFYRGAGCKSCKGEGYRGRVAIIEVVKMTQDLRDLTLRRADSGTINMKLKELGVPSLRTEGIKAVLQGLTTIEEIVRVTQDLEEM